MPAQAQQHVEGGGIALLYETIPGKGWQQYQREQATNNDEGLPAYHARQKQTLNSLIRRFPRCGAP